MATKPVNCNLDFQSVGSILNVIIQVLSSAPGSPATGQVYYDSVLNALRVYDGSAWTNRATDSLLLQGNNGAYYLARGNATGTQLSSTISDLATVVQAYSLSSFALPTGNLNLNGFKFTNAGTPTSGTDLTNKAYVDGLVQGMQLKPTAQCATAAALPANTYANGTAGVGATLTATSNGALVVDTTYTVLLNDLVWVQNEVTSANDGLYVQTQLGDGSHPWILTRHVDMDQATEFGGALCAVENGTANNGALFLCNVANSITVGTTPLSFVRLNSGVTYTASNGVQLVANNLSVKLPASSGLTADGTGLYLNATIAAKCYTVAVGDGSSTAIVVTHNLNKRAVGVTVSYAATPWNEIICAVERTTVNTVTLRFNTAPTSGQFTCTVVG